MRTGAAMALALLAAGPVIAANRAVSTRPAVSPIAAREVVVRLLATAVVAGDEVKLGDIAEVDGDAAPLLSEWSLGAAPHPGRTGSITLVQVQAMLSRRGVNLSHWIFRGSSGCVVTRVATAAPRSVIAPSSRPSRDYETSQTSQPAEPANANTLEGVLRKHICARLAPLGGIPIIRFSPALAKILKLARPTFDFEITDRGQHPLGMVPYEVAILENGTLRQTVPALVEVKLRRAVVVAARPVNRGETIEAGALALEERVFERAEEIGSGAVAPLVGQRARRFVDQRAMVYARDVEPLPLIMRNDMVTVTARRGNLVISSTAKAVTSGSFGEQVVLKNEMSKDTFAARITGNKTAEMGEKDAVETPRALAEGGR